MSEKKKVAIVNAGGHGMLSAEAGDYDSLVKSMQVLLERATWAGELALDVSVVRGTEEALEWVGYRGVIFYVTVGMASEAEKVRSEHSQVRVIVLTGEPWRGGVIYLHKGWVNGDTFADLALKGF